MDDIIHRIDERLRAPETPQPRKPVQLAWSIPGFGPMTRIGTSFGEVHAQALRKRDLVRTQSGQNAEIQYIDRIKIDQDFMERTPDSYPILIRAGALGSGLPKNDILLSPAQQIGLGRHAFDVRFVRASEMLGRPGVIRKPEEMMTYTVFHCGGPVCVRTEGIWAKLDP